MENVRDVVTELHIHVFVLVSQVTQYDLVSNQYIVKSYKESTIIELFHAAFKMVKQ